MSSQSLAEFAATFDRASLQPQLAQAEHDRERFRARYPMARLGEVTLEEYAAGGDGDEETLARMLAIGTPALGDVRGAAFNQTRIFKLKGTGLYKSRLENAGEAADDWLRLRAALVKCCELGAAGDWEGIDRVSVSNWIPAIRTKLLHIYFPDEVLPMFVSGELAHYLEVLRVGFSPGYGRWAAAPNRHLLLHLRSMPELVGWSTTELVLLLRAWFPKPKEKAGMANQREAILRAMRELREQDPVANDVVHHEVVKQYAREHFDGMDIKDCGTVMNDMVNPDLGGNPNSQVPMRYRLLERVRPGEFRLFEDSTPEPEPVQFPVMPALNQILYGPPGTGKTYNVIRRAAKIATGRDGMSDAEAKQHYDELSKAGRIRLATFHQSFSYEDFIEGIRPVMEEGGAAKFEIRPGVFKQIALEALFACLEATDDPRERVVVTQAEAGNTLAPSVRRPGTGTITGRVWQLADELKSRKAVIAAATDEGVNINTVLTQYSHWRRANKVSNGSTELSTSRATSDNEEEPKRISSDQAVAFAISYLKDGPASGWQLRADKVFPPYVLIIDEINRGNISRIFGELITLIEDDKRHGTDNALTVTLPTSRELFAVPPNLFLLGTMNTADKSLALLDVALRRRFEFEELAPDFTCCSGFPPLRAVMDEMNLRLELSKDRDHRIGHAFFMGVTDAASFNQVFRRKVVPLLQEYFFNDIDGARYVLGDTGDTGFLRALRREDRQRRTAWRWFTDEEQGRRENEKLDCWARLRSNYGIGDV